MTEQVKRVPLTDAEYVTDGGAHCPFCGSTYLEGGTIEADSNIAWQPIECRECRNTWDDVYQLVGYQTGEDQEVIGA